MVFVLLIGTILSSISVNFFSKQYNEKAKHYNLWLFSGMTMLGVLFFFLMQTGFQIRIVKERISTLLSLLLLELIPASIAGPLTAGGDIVMAFILAVGYYHEKLSKSQLAGYLLGTISVIFLNM